MSHVALLLTGGRHELKPRLALDGSRSRWARLSQYMPPSDVRAMAGMAKAPRRPPNRIAPPTSASSVVASDTGPVCSRLGGEPAEQDTTRKRRQGGLQATPPAGCPTPSATPPPAQRRTHHRGACDEPDRHAQRGSTSPAPIVRRPGTPRAPKAKWRLRPAHRPTRACCARRPPPDTGRGARPAPPARTSPRGRRPATSSQPAPRSRWRRRRIAVEIITAVQAHSATKASKLTTVVASTALGEPERN